MIDTQDQLKEFLPALRKTDWIGLDTEADSLHSYPEKLCLLQISLPGTDVLIDPLASLDVAPLRSLQMRYEMRKGVLSVVQTVSTTDYLLQWGEQQLRFGKDNARGQSASAGASSAGSGCPAIGRSNLTVATLTHVTRIVFQGTRAVGVRCVRWPPPCSRTFSGVMRAVMRAHSWRRLWSHCLLPCSHPCRYRRGSTDTAYLRRQPELVRRFP